MSIRLYVGNLPAEVERQALETLFTIEGEVISTKVIRDRKTNKCRGFAFLTVETVELAEQLIEKFNGHAFGDNTLKLEIAQPRDKAEGEDSMAEDGGEEPSGSGDSPKAVARSAGKKRNRNTGSRTQSAANTTNANTATQPDPRWANQLQRIKDQLQSAGQG